MEDGGIPSKGEQGGRDGPVGSLVRVRRSGQRLRHGSASLWATRVQLSLATFMKDKKSLWASICKKYDLEHHPYEKLAQWTLEMPGGGFPADNFSDVTKLRQAGFQGMNLDTCAPLPLSAGFTCYPILDYSSRVQASPGLAATCPIPLHTSNTNKQILLTVALVVTSHSYSHRRHLLPIFHRLSCKSFRLGHVVQMAQLHGSASVLAFRA
eukprot:jgi/Botrbrau1/3095/Bobra.0070s0080.1